MNDAPFVSLPIYTAATTTTAPPTTMFEPANNHHPQSPLTIPAGCICFRLLCHASRIGGVFRKSIKQLQRDTSAQIRLEDPPPDSDDRVICVVGSCFVDRTMTFDDEENNNGYLESSEYTEVSAAQEALVRVYERILSVAAEADGVYFAPGGVVSCRLLTNTAVVGYVIGKGGHAIEKIRKDTGCKIRIFSQSKLPSCAMNTDEMIQFEGDVLAIKRALVALSGRIQECPQPDRPKTVFNRPANGHMEKNQFPETVNPWETTLTNGYTDFRTQPTSTGSANHVIGSSTAPPMDLKNPQFQHEVIFRFLCPQDRVGGVIGTSGSIVRALQNQSGASIYIEPPPKSDCDDRLITVTAIESAESQNSAAQHGVILVFNRCVEAGYERGLDLPSARTLISARLCITLNQMGCLLGKGGSIIHDMRKVTGAFIKIVPIEEVSRCKSEADQVVLITGEFMKVRDALYSVTGRLRNHLFSSRAYNGPKTRGNIGHSSMPTPRHYSQHTNLTQSMDNLRIFNNEDDHPSSSRPWGSQAGARNSMKGADVGSTSGKGGIELGRGGRSALVTNTTVEIVVSEDVIASVYGENGNNLTQLKQISGAKVAVHQAGSGSSDHIVIISGTPDQTQSAQSLLQAFIFADQS